ncbi:glycosyltransferase family 4 protein [Lichenihabitans sp. PAMC28606]|uniref:glycosyltransferase family 4 protein n=1 Tax=Lichenihabitans sp. PAMC28606 TaxID=2880932 RepID=UPI0029CAB556|nr:glycosyltransferase family 4 protein [Lichenihabitans sp. PAMC28606]
MRICFVSRRYFPAISGMSVYAVNLLRELVRAGHDVTMISQYRGDTFGTRVYGGGPPPAVPGVAVIGLEQIGEQTNGDFERDIDTMIATIKAAHERKPFDLLHAQYGYPTGWATLLAARDLGIPAVVSIQGGDGHWVGSCCDTHRLAMQRVLDGADALLIGGESFVEEVSDRLGTARERFTIVPGAVDTERFRPADEAKVGVAPFPVRLLYHGRVDRRKGALDFLDALDVLRTRGVAFRATVSGIGPDLDACKARAADLAFDAHTVGFTGYAAYEAVPDIYREHDIFVSPTYGEGFSNTILEAMASGLANMSCFAVGVNDCLRNGENGLLVEPGDIAGQADGLQRLIEDAAFRRRIAVAGLTECRRDYSWETVGRMIMTVYARVLRAPARGRVDARLPMTDCRFRAEPHLL